MTWQLLLLITQLFLPTDSPTDAATRSLDQRSDTIDFSDTPLGSSNDTAPIAPMTTATFPVIFCPDVSGDMLDSNRLWTARGFRIDYLRGRGEAGALEGTIEVTRRLLTFPGNAAPRRDSFEIWNLGPGLLDVQLDIIDATAPEFTIIEPAGGAAVIDTSSGTLVVIEFSGARQASANVRIQSNAINERVTTVALSADVRSGSQLSAVPDFVFTDVGTCDTLFATLKNIRGAPIVFGQIYLATEACGLKLLPSLVLGDTILRDDGFTIGLVYCAGCPSAEATDQVVIQDIAGTTLARIGVRATQRTLSQLRATPGTLDFGRLDPGICADGQIEISNESADIDTVSITGLTILGGGTLVITDPLPSAWTFMLRPGETRTITLRYCPRVVDDSLTALLRLETMTRLPLLISVRGRSSVATSEERFVWIDSASATAGEMVTLSIHVAPAIPATSPVAGYSVQLRYDSRALYPVGATDATTGTDMAIERNQPGNLTLRDNRRLSGDVLARVRFRSLSTGRESNFVAFEAGTLDDVISLRASAPGLVVLDGCDIGRPSGLNRRATIRNIVVTGEGGLLRYTAPDGARATIRLTSASGAVVLTIELPAATGTEQETRFDMGDVPPGFYLLELRVGDGRSTIPLMIAR